MSADPYARTDSKWVQRFNGYERPLATLGDGINLKTHSEKGATAVSTGFVPTSFQPSDMEGHTPPVLLHRWEQFKNTESYFEWP